MLRSTASRVLFRSNRSHNYFTRFNAIRQQNELIQRTLLGATRSLYNTTSLRNETTTSTTSTTSSSSSIDPLIQQQQKNARETLTTLLSKNDARGAVRYLQTLYNNGLKSPLNAEEYISLLQLVRQSNDADLRSVVCRWFYIPRDKSPIHDNVIENVNVWNELLKLAFKQVKGNHTADLSMLVSKFTKTFKLQEIKNIDTLSILMRAYGILGRPDSIKSCFEIIQSLPHNNEAIESAIIAYAQCGEKSNVEQLLKTIDQPSETLYSRIARFFAFRGDTVETHKYVQRCSKEQADPGLVFLAFKIAIDHEYMNQIHNGYSTGTTVKFLWNKKLQELDAAWHSEITATEKFDVVQLNHMLEYLSKAHIINPKLYPMEKLESFFREKMTSLGVEPNAFTYKTLLRTYSRSQQYADDATSNTRLDKALDLFQEIQQKQINLDIRTAFHALYAACIPHEGNAYPFDNFLDVQTNKQKKRLHLDKRFFEIEKIMLDSRIRYDQQSLLLALTCLGTSRQYRAMWNRWNLIKQSGLKRDNTLYRHIFALASMDKKQSQYALSVVKEELIRELPAKNVGWGTYVAMLNCCITAQDPVVAKQILNTMPKAYGNEKNKDTLQKLNNYNKPNAQGYYQPMLLASTMIKGLESEADALFNQVQLPYDQTLWRAAMYRAVQQGGEDRSQKLQQLFTQYTMQRFEQFGKIPIPVRENAPVVPFPSGPYSKFDMHMINLYLASLVDSQEVSLALDVFKTLKEQQPNKKLQLSNKTVKAFIQLAKREKSDEDFKWLLDKSK
ncbi:hypothetical protein INT45_002286 [Circinella minor]|uniref:Pentacotripeptide-repeat region of PRORP domain-containing protein n=1 Tax=Circinella minor TaxID=1195481 RepID=A0A8H7VM01_9FUNG|nr:hypothetical protein INT45_002286 [Circinella minor]